MACEMPPSAHVEHAVAVGIHDHLSLVVVAEWWQPVGSSHAEQAARAQRLVGVRCFNRNGNEVFYGRTPIVAVGTTDMHAQTQQHQDGKRNKVVQFVKVAQWEKDAVIPNAFPSAPKLAEISSLYLSQALEVARVANADALMSDQRFNANFVMPKLNAYHLGELLYLLALSVAYEGELANVDAFDQPGVEAYKRLMGPRLTALSKQ